MTTPEIIKQETENPPTDEQVKAFEIFLYKKDIADFDENNNPLVKFVDAEAAFNEWKAAFIVEMNRNIRYESGTDKTGFLYTTQIFELLNPVTK